MVTSIDNKFPSSFHCFSESSGDKGMISSADILQIVNIQLVFLLFLVVVRLFRLQFKTCKIFRILVLLSRNNDNLDSRASELPSIILTFMLILMSFSIHRKTSFKFGQRWVVMKNQPWDLSQSETENYILSDK